MCELRWYNYLAPGIKKGAFSTEEVRAACSRAVGDEVEFCRSKSSLRSKENSETAGLPLHSFYLDVPTWQLRIIGARFMLFVDLMSLNCRNGHMKRKMVAEGQLPAEVPTYHVTRTDLSAASGSGSFMHHLNEDPHVRKRVRHNPQPPPEMYPPIPNLSVLQNCKSLPYVIALAALLIELCEQDDPQMLCRVIAIANELLQTKKGISSAMKIFISQISVFSRSPRCQ